MPELLLSTRKGLFRVTRRHTGWVVKPPHFLGENVSLALAHDRWWYAALHHGHFGAKLKASPDGGETWEERAVPAYPEGAVIATADGKPPAPATMKQFWALEAHGSRLWAGTAPGGLFHSDDAGQTWTLNESLWNEPARGEWGGAGSDIPALHSIRFDGHTLLVAVSTGGVWRSTDAGGTWANVGEGLFAEYMPPELRFKRSAQDAHMLVQCRDAPEHVWVQHHNGVFKSGDGGLTFEHCANAPSNGFGFGVVVDPRDGLTAWFVPAIKDETRVPKDGQLAVTRTRDGGKTFETITAGLPTESAYDIVYRHALAIDDVGNTLAMASTTGGLWISEDRGTGWQRIDVRLPPVHAVRFV